MKSREELLKEKYGFDKNSYKYIPAGSVILEYIGQVVMFIDFKKDSEKGWSVVGEKKVRLDSMTDFDPMTMTYLCTYTYLNENNEEVKEEVRIIPEGFSWGNPEETGEMKRFIPYSLHCKLVEDEAFHDRLCKLWDTAETLKIEELTDISRSKEKSTILRYSHNIGALIRLEKDGEILWVRILDLVVTHKAGTKYKMKIIGDSDSWAMIIDSQDPEYEFESGIGKLKIIDLTV